MQTTQYCIFKQYILHLYLLENLSFCIIQSTAAVYIRSNICVFKVFPNRGVITNKMLTDELMMVQIYHSFDCSLKVKSWSYIDPTVGNIQYQKLCIMHL